MESEENEIKKLYEIVEKSFSKIKELYSIKPDEIEGYIEPVSYTHLTLPTILRV